MRLEVNTVNLTSISNVSSANLILNTEKSSTEYKRTLQAQLQILFLAHGALCKKQSVNSTLVAKHMDTRWLSESFFFLVGT